MYEELIQRLRNDAKNQEQVLHIWDLTQNGVGMRSLATSTIIPNC